MIRDWIVAGLLTVLGVSTFYKPIQHPVVRAFWYPPFHIGIVLLVSLFVYLRLDFSALVLVAVYLLLFNNTQVNTLEKRRVETERAVDSGRFDPRTSIDLQFANRSITHDPPDILGWTADASPLLLYPPSQSTLRSMSG